MSSILQEADEAFRRWKSMNATEPPATVAVYLRDHEKPIYFTGLTLAPTGGSGAFAISGLGYALPIHVLRDSDIARIVIGEQGQSGIGFQQQS